MALFLFVIIIAIALGILGIVLKGLFWLLIIGIVLFLANLVFGGIRLGKSRNRVPGPRLTDPVRVESVHWAGVLWPLCGTPRYGKDPRYGTVRSADVSPSVRSLAVASGV